MHTFATRRARAAAGVLLAASITATTTTTLQASGSGTPKDETRSSETQAQAAKPWDRGLELVENDEFEAARQIFEQLAVEDPKNAEVLNMLAYTQRKTGDIDEAIANYGRALKLKPKFPQAREYLAEAYLQAALREAKTLEGYGKDGREELRKLADAFQEAQAQLEGTAGSKTGKGGKSAGGW